MERIMNHNVILITGAAAGLGRDLALVMAGRGWRVAAVDIDEAGGKSLVQEIEQAGGGAKFLRGDLSLPATPGRMVDWAVEQFGRLDALVNNAGILFVEPYTAQTAAVWDKILAVNVRAVALAMSAAARVMIRQGFGRIVNVTSPASRAGHAQQTAYSCSKAAIDSLTRSGAVALAKHGIAVNSIAPGMMDTAMHRNLERDMMKIEGATDFQAFHDERTRRIPAGRRPEVREVTEALVWLVADAPSYITAERLNVSGGFDKD
jgi:NAD(P)-dependent dehydrogenase (short-subunit alcohol dehydrogenase family)